MTERECLILASLLHDIGKFAHHQNKIFIFQKEEINENLKIKM